MFRPRSRTFLAASIAVLALLTSCKTVDYAPRPRGPRTMAPDRAVEAVAATIPAGAPVTEIPFRAENATLVFQSALDRAARAAGETARTDGAPPTVIVPDAGSPWVLETIRVPSGIRLVFEPGAEVQALRGSFKDSGQVLFELKDVQNVEILGYGATIRMWREDYQGRDYDRGQWRHIFSLRGVTNVRIAGLTLLESGGDGVYVGRGRQNYSRDVHLLDLTIRDQHRQAVSVISAENLLIERCVLSATRGHFPMAGIDFEPNRADERFVNCVVRDSVITDNIGAGVMFQLRRFDETTRPFDVRIENTLISGNGLGLLLLGTRQGARGTIDFTDSDLYGIRFKVPLREVDLDINEE